MRFNAWVAAMSAWLWTLTASAQSGGPPGFGDSMDRGLVPLFFYVAASVAVMAVATVVTVVFMRRGEARSLPGA